MKSLLTTESNQKIKKMRNLISYIVLIILFSGCSSNSNAPKEASNDTGGQVENQVENKQLNINVLLDLSDRLERNLVPNQKERDIEIIKSLTDIFKNEMQTKGAFMAKGKMKVHFSPLPPNPDINSLANSLSVDLSEKQSKQKKEIYDNISDDFAGALEQIYSNTLSTRNWIGCDIWRFFKNNVAEDCIEDPEVYNNYLIILTDGYIYHENSVMKDGNKTQYVTQHFLGKENLRGLDWNEKYESEDYGLMPIDQNLSGLKVLVLEVNPSESSKMDEDVLFRYWRDWLAASNIDVENNFKLYTTELSNTTISRVKKFIK